MILKIYIKNNTNYMIVKFRLLGLLLFSTLVLAVAPVALAESVPNVLGIEIDLAEPENSIVDISPDQNVFQNVFPGFSVTKPSTWEFNTSTDILSIINPASETENGVSIMVFTSPNFTNVDNGYEALQNALVNMGMFGFFGLEDLGTVNFRGRQVRKVMLEITDTIETTTYVLPYGNKLLWVAYYYGANNEDQSGVDTVLNSMTFEGFMTPTMDKTYSDSDGTITLTPSSDWDMKILNDSVSNIVADLRHGEVENAFAKVRIRDLGGYYDESTNDEIYEIYDGSAGLGLEGMFESLGYTYVAVSSDKHVFVSATLPDVYRKQERLDRISNNSVALQTISYLFFLQEKIVEFDLYVFDPTNDDFTVAARDFESGVVQKLVLLTSLRQDPVIDNSDPNDFYNDDTPIISPPLPDVPEPELPADHVTIGEVSHFRGNVNAPVTIIEYADFECPYCQRFEETLQQAFDEFGTQIRLVFKHYPLTGIHSKAQKAAEAAECAGQQGKFWEMHDALFTMNSAGTLSVDNYKQQAATLGLDIAVFNNCLDNGGGAVKVVLDYDDAASAGVTGVPASFVNGVLLPGAVSYETLKAAIEAALQKYQPVEVERPYDSEAKQKVVLRNAKLASNVKGRIMLKVEDKGRAYYMNPLTSEGRFLGRAEDAYAVMREEGVGITTNNLKKIPVALDNLTGIDSDNDGLPDAFEDAIGTDKNKRDTDNDGYLDKEELLNNYSPTGKEKLVFDTAFARQQYGKIFLQVENRGEAWYINPQNGKRYFLGRAEDAYKLMRTLALGISNKDFDLLEK